MCFYVTVFQAFFMSRTPRIIQYCLYIFGPSTLMSKYSMLFQRPPQKQRFELKCYLKKILYIQRSAYIISIKKKAHIAALSAALWACRSAILQQLKYKYKWLKKCVRVLSELTHFRLWSDRPPTCSHSKSVF